MKVSNSSIQAFKACRRMYELKYIYGLEPVESSEAIKRGLKYHEAVENLIKQDIVVADDIDDPKIRAMVEAFRIFVLPKLRALYNVSEAENWFSYTTKSGHTVVGRIDALSKDGVIVEHKTTSGAVDGDYFAKLEFDEQIPTYMIAQGSDKVIYTVCAAPLLRQKKVESEEDYFKRCLEWYIEDPDQRIVCTEIKLDKDRLEQFADEQDAVISEMENCKLFYRNPNHCYRYNRLCEYAPVCMNFDPEQEYIEFKRREKHDETTGEAKD